jgi:hypothetical protein
LHHPDIDGEVAYRVKELRPDVTLRLPKPERSRPGRIY